MQGFNRRAMLRGIAAVGLAGLAPAYLGASPLAKVKANGTLRVALYKDNAPWSWRQDGKTVGIDADLARAFAAKLGVNADLAELMADESVDDDLRNGVWKGGLLGFAPADLMLHIPFERGFSARNDQVAIVAPYYRESFQFACRRGSMDCEGALTSFRGRRLAAELDSIPDFYLIGSFGGILTKDVTHYPTGYQAVLAMAKGDADGVLASRAQIEAGLHHANATHVDRRKMPLPAFTSPGWNIGMAVKDNSRTLGDAVETIMAGMAKSGELTAIFDTYGVTYAPPVLT